MSAREHRRNKSLVDLRMLPLAILSLAIGAVVSYSVGSNFGLGYVPIDNLPQTAAELVQDKAANTSESILELARESSPKTAPPPQAVATQQTAPPAEPDTPQSSSQAEPQPPANPGVAAVVTTPAETAKQPASETGSSVATAVAPAVAPEQTATVATADTTTEDADIPDKPETVAEDSVVPVKNTIVQSVTTDEDGNEIVRLTVESSDFGGDGPDADSLPDTAEIVARANLAAGVTPEPEETEFESELVLALPDPEEEELARFSTDPEDLPILKVIIPDAEPPKAAATVPELEDAEVEFTEATLSREITDAVDSGVVPRVLKLIEDGEPIDGKDRSGQTMLLKAAWNGDKEMFDALLELGANIQVTSNDGRTPLFSAAVSGNIDLVKKLVSMGASVDTKTNEGKTPLMVSAWSNYPEMARYLLAQGAKPDLIDGNGRNALFYALWDRNIDVIRTLIQYGARLDQVDTDGHSAVDIARLRRIELPGMNLEAEQKSIN